MKLVSKLVVAVFLLATSFIHAQMTPQCRTWVSIFDADTGQWYQDIYNGPASVKGCVPWNIEHRLRVVIGQDCSNGGEGCSALPHFTTLSFHGANATVEPGSIVYAPGTSMPVEFTISVLGNNNITLSGIQCNGERLKAVINFCPRPGDPDPTDPTNPCVKCPEDPCLGYETTTCCDMECIRFYIKDPVKCPGCYLVTVQFEDGSTQVINLSFGNNIALMHCFTQKIVWVTSISAYPCPGCEPATQIGLKESMRRENNANINPEIQAPERIKIAPNPTKTVLNFEGEQLSDYSLTLFDAQGKQVLHQDQITNPVNLEKLAKGTYFYKIADKQGYKQTGQVIKE